MRLTGLLLPELKLVSVPARADHWARVRVEWQVPVLRTLAWPAMTFEQIDRKLRSLRDPELDAAVIDRIGAWAAALRAAIPELRARLDAEVARLDAEAGEGFGRAAAAHPAASWLQRRRAGKLSSEHLGCASPQQLLALAAALGVSLEATPV